MPETHPTAAATAVPKSFLGRLRWAVSFTFARLRFVLILAAIGLVIVQWDTLAGWYAKWTRPAGVVEAAGDVEYFCPMHPTVVRDNNKEKCPICFMPLSKRKKGDDTAEALPAGVVSRVQLTPYRVVLAGVATTPVAYLPLAKELVTVGTVEFDERGLRHVASRVKGRIDRLFINQTGQMVQAGDALAEVYSPDLVTTVQNLLDAQKTGNPDLMQMARDRLRLWGIEKDQVEEILRTGKPITRLTIRSPIDGHVLRKYPREGQYVEEGGPLYDVADLATVWVQAQLYEEDLAFLPKGAHDPKTGLPQERIPVTATVRGFPGQEFGGNLSFVYPHVEQESRTLSVRFELDNPDHDLRPGMSATVRLGTNARQLGEIAGGRLQLQGGKVLAVPESSVIDAGGRTVVYRQELPGTFEGVLVELGPKMTGPEGVEFYPVLKGVNAGDVVVTSGSFLIDAETRLNPAAGSIYGGGGNSGKVSSASGPAVRPTTPEDEDAKVALALARLEPADRKIAEAQRYCPILQGSKLGSMGVPAKVMLDGRPVFVCCKGCIDQAKAESARVLARVEELKSKAAPAAKKQADEEKHIREALALLPAGERKQAEAQRLCPVTGERLGSMGAPAKVNVQGKYVFTCCEGCNDTVTEKPDEALKKVKEFQRMPAKPKK